jgi:exonuclease III
LSLILILGKTNNSKNINLRIGSLNCLSLAKPNQPTVSSEFIRFLRSQSFDVVSLQETHASDPETQQTLDMKFHAKSSIWSRHCGIVSLNSSVVLVVEQRLIITDIE